MGLVLKLEIVFLTYISMLIDKEFDELWDRDRDTSNPKPILDPLAIITNIIKRDDKEINEKEEDMKKYNEINNNSSLRSIGIMFFRHQHILKILNEIIIVLNVILEFSTSKVDIL